MRGVWIEIMCVQGLNVDKKSLPMRGVWIEMHFVTLSPRELRVTPHAGSVD